MSRLKKDAPWEYRVVTDAIAMKPLEPFTADTIRNLFAGTRGLLSRAQIGWVLNHDKRVECIGKGLYRWKREEPAKCYDCPEYAHHGEYACNTCDRDEEGGIE